MSIVTETRRHITYFYNSDVASFDENILSELFLQPRPDTGITDNNSAGRGPVQYRQYCGIPVVVKHYRRGGLVRRISHDVYCNIGLQRSRVARELNLLDLMTEHGLPVPFPVAGRFERLAGCLYRADLVTRQIPAIGSVAQVLVDGGMSNGQWQSLGKTLGRFHQHGVYHADLNADNILINARGEFSLIDFDRGRVYHSVKDRHRWSTTALERLKRSLQKLGGVHPSIRFDDSHWAIMLASADL